VRQSIANLELGIFEGLEYIYLSIYLSGIITVRKKDLILIAFHKTADVSYLENHGLWLTKKEIPGPLK